MVGFRRIRGKGGNWNVWSWKEMAWSKVKGMGSWRDKKRNRTRNWTRNRTRYRTRYWTGCRTRTGSFVQDDVKEWNECQWDFWGLFDICWKSKTSIKYLIGGDEKSLLFFYTGERPWNAACWLFEIVEVDEKYMDVSTLL